MGTLRFLLAASVLIVHSSPIFGITFLPGYLAVQLFYVISGFYMTLTYCEKYINKERPLFLFYSNRFFKIYPLYLFIIILTIFLGIAYGVWLGSYGKLEYFKDYYTLNNNSIGALIIIGLANISLVGQDIITFFTINDYGSLQFLGLQKEMTLQPLLLIPIAWTISVEIFFYLLTPFVVNRKIQGIFFVLAGVLLLRLILYWFFNIHDRFSIYRFAPTEFFWFLLGVLSYKLYQNERLPTKSYGLICWIVLILILFSYGLHKMDWLLFTALVVCMPSIFYKVSTHTWDRYLGDLSYPIYISHYLIFLIVSANKFPKPFGSGLPLFVMTLTFSILCYHFLLKKIELFRISRVH
jgi:peptidoglycan/LPS O-acetylase OafA/YrhL